MFKPFVKRLIKHSTNVVRGLPPLLAVAKWTVALSPRLNQFTRRVLIASFAEGKHTPEIQLSDAELRVVIDLREAIQAWQKPRA